MNIKYQKFFRFGKAANNFLVLLHALGYCKDIDISEIEKCDEIPEAEELLGLFVYADCKKNADGYLEPKFCGFEPYETETKTPPKAPKETQAEPF